MIEYGIDRTNELIRRSLLDLRAIKISEDRAVIDEAIGYFDRTTDRDAVRGALKDRFAVGIVRDTANTDSDAAGYETYRKGAIGEAIDQGLVETVTSGIGTKITSALATLFSLENQAWVFTNPGGAPDDNAEALIKAHRNAGGFSTTLVNADYLACAVNSAFVYVSWISGHLKYHLVTPTCFHAIFHETITDNGEPRPVDYTEIEDATAVVIRLSDAIDANPGVQQYLAVFGRSEVYPVGRMVTYRSSRWDGIPDYDPKDTSGREYLIDGQPANPLSYYAAAHPDEVVPEYPFVAIDGGYVKTGRSLNNVTTTLYENCLEVDIAYSRLLKDALNSARGKDVITNERGAPLPRSLEGVVSLQDGQSLEVMGQPASNAQGAFDVLEGLVVSIGAGYNVPDYQLVSDPATLTAPSGIALFIRTQPLINFRAYRAELNRPQVQRLFDIERCLITAYLPEQAGVLSGVEQSWSPGVYQVPEDPLLHTQRLEAAERAGLLDHVSAVREYHNLATDVEAIALIDKHMARSKKYPSPAQQEAEAQKPLRRAAAPVGLVRRQTTKE